ncbi:MAG: hypothetical protein JW784_02460, partial [Candidatus Cloacimonetes bacterium]|nr:hypothetical protein [Candidatus Cloacimonadota bacterium]
IKIKRDSYQLYQGIAPDHHLIILPPGVIEFPFEKSSLNGSFLADRVYYKDQVYENVKISFSEGIVRFMTFHSEIQGNFQLQGKLINSQDECLLSLGFNEACQDFTNFYLYDRCLPGNICLKFFDNESYPVILASRKAVIRKRKSLIEKLTKKDI